MVPRLGKFHAYVELAYTDDGDTLSSTSLESLLEDVSVVPAWEINWTVFNDLNEVASNVSANVTRFERRPDVSVPEPGTALLMAMGLLGIGLARRRRNAV